MTEPRGKVDECEHDYEDRAQWNWDYEWYVCKKCGHSYKLYYDEMR